MKLLAVDVDGVLNQGKLSNYGLQHDQVEQLKRIVKETDCYIVITSTWRLHESGRKRLSKLFVEIGANFLGFTTNLTPSLESGEDKPKFLREIELKDFIDNLSAYQLTNLKLCILDDHEPFNLYAKYLVKPDGHIGLTPELANQAIKLLS